MVRAGGARRGGQGAGWLPRIVELAIVLLIAWLAVRLVYAFVTPTTPVAGEGGSDRGPAAPAADMAVFSRFDPFAASAVTAEADPVIEARATSLDITLNGIWAEADGSGIAIIQTSNSDQRMVQVGEEIMSGVTLDRLYSDRAIILRGGVRESVFLANRLNAGPSNGSSSGSAGRPVSTAPTGQPLAAPGYPDRAGASISDLTTIISVRPVRQGNQTVGYELFPRGDGTVFSRLGFVDGDRILSVNGQPAPNDSERLLEMIETFQSATSVMIVVDRGGERLNLTVNASEF
nr:hypothetical protein GCM10011355_28610 [Aquisalinus luteolus]